MSGLCCLDVSDIPQRFDLATSRSLAYLCDEYKCAECGQSPYPVWLSFASYLVVIPLFIHPCCRQSQPAAQSIRAATMEVLYTHRPGKSAMI